MPRSVRVIHNGAFCESKTLKKAVLNEGLEVLGTEECSDGGEHWRGVF